MYGCKFENRNMFHVGNVYMQLTCIWNIACVFPPVGTKKGGLSAGFFIHLLEVSYHKSHYKRPGLGSWRILVWHLLPSVARRCQGGRCAAFLSCTAKAGVPCACVPSKAASELGLGLQCMPASCLHASPCRVATARKEHFLFTIRC